MTSQNVTRGQGNVRSMPASQCFGFHGIRNDVSNAGVNFKPHLPCERVGQSGALLPSTESTTLSPWSFTVATQQVLGSISPAKILTCDDLHPAPKEDLFRCYCTQYTFGWPSYISSVRVIVFMQRYHATCDVLLHHSCKISLYVRVYAVAHSYLLCTLGILDYRRTIFDALFWHEAQCYCQNLTECSTKYSE